MRIQTSRSSLGRSFRTKPARVFVVDGVTEETVIDVIDAEAADAPFVLVDLGVVARGAACLAGRLGVGVEGLSLRMALG